MLLEYGAPLNAGGRGWTPLQAVADTTGIMHLPDFVHTLCRHGADVNARNKLGRTPLAACAVASRRCAPSWRPAPTRPSPTTTAQPPPTAPARTRRYSNPWGSTPTTTKAQPQIDADKHRPSTCFADLTPPGLGWTGSGEVVYYHDSAIYSIFALSNPDESVVERYRHTAYGQTTVLDADGSDDANDLSDVENPYLFQSRRWEGAAGIMQFRHREYAPDLGRFLTRDPAGYRDAFNSLRLCHPAPHIGDRSDGIGTLGRPLLDFKYWRTVDSLLHSLLQRGGRRFRVLLRSLLPRNAGRPPVFLWELPERGQSQRSGAGLV